MFKQTRQFTRINYQSAISSSSKLYHSQSAFRRKIAEFARLPQTTLKLYDMISCGPIPTPAYLLQQARFLHREVPVRLAKKVRELESLPYGLSLTPPVQLVKAWYEQSFRDIMSVAPPLNQDDELVFTQILEKILDRHKNVVPMMAQGVLEMKKQRNLHNRGEDLLDDCPYLQDFLDRFYSSRIAVRMLISQHCALHHPREGFIGVVDSRCSVVKVARMAISDATRICERTYCNAPDVIVHGDPNLIIHYEPAHLHHMLFELLKNSMRAVVEYHGSSNYDAPPVQISIVNNCCDVAIKISDQGSAMSSSDLTRIWSYMYTSVKKQQTPKEGFVNLDESSVLQAVGIGNGDFEVDHSTGGEIAPMAGFGYGLPISRLYARFFGGDLQISSVINCGTDVYMFLQKLDDREIELDSYETS